MSVFDQIVLLATGLAALFLIWLLFKNYQAAQDPKPSQNLYYILSLAVLFVSGVLLIFFGFEVLASPWVVIVAALIPAGLSLGLITEFYPKYAKWYLAFVIIGLLAIAVTRFTGPPRVATIVLAVVHSVCGAVIIVTPVLAVKRGLAPAGYIFVSIGGILIGLGGVALAFLKMGSQLLFFSADFVFLILAPLLLLMTLAFLWGFVVKLRSPAQT
jgi:hypothetical protein